MSQNHELMECEASRTAAASAVNLPEDQKPTLTEALTAGLEWLLRTEQDDEAVCSHHGAVIHTRQNRYLTFCPEGADRRPVISLNVHRVKRNLVTLDIYNPLEPGEMQRLREELAALGATVTRTWNGDGCETGSVALAEDVPASLKRALLRYHDGCTEHPSRSVFCDCGWYQRGTGRLVLPTLPARA